MKQLNEYCEQISSIYEYLSTKVKVKKNILDNIDPNEWKWRSSYSSDAYQKQFKETVKNFVYSEMASELYPGVKKYDITEQLYRDTLKAYMSNGWNKSQEELDKRCDEEIRYLNKTIRETGWSQYEYHCLEQGWWAFIAWVIDKKYNNK